MIFGNGFLEAVYEEALSLEFRNNKIPFTEQKQINIYYKNKLLNKKYFADFICFDKILIELKVCEKIIDEHIGQIINYLKATDIKLGIIINFGSKSLEYKRIANTNS